MPFQKAHVSIVRSIRQVSLVRDWQRARGAKALPDVADFIPNERAGDAADLLLNEVVRHGDGVRYRCRTAGERVEQLYGVSMASRYLDDCLDSVMAAAAQPIWDACMFTRLPVYSIVPVMDHNGCPVTVEQIFLPYGGPRDDTDFMLAALHAWSTEGRFLSQGLLRGIAKAPLHWAVLVDPALKLSAKPDADQAIEFG